MKFHQLFTYSNVASLGVDKEHRLEIVQVFLDSDCEEEVATNNFQSEIAEKQRKSRGKNQYTDTDHFNSLFSQNYIYSSNEEEKIYEYSRFGRKFRLRFRVSYVLFLAIVKDIRKTYK